MSIIKEILKIEGMSCVSCAQTIEKSLQKVKGVRRANVNFATERSGKMRPTAVGVGGVRSRTQMPLSYAGCFITTGFENLGDCSEFRIQARWKICLLKRAIFKLAALFISG